VIPNIEFFVLDDRIPGPPRVPPSPIPDVYSWSMCDYGDRVGVFRLMDVMAKHGVRGTVVLNANLCDHHPEIVLECSGPRLGAHGA
jgi:hypothetical protein